MRSPRCPSGSCANTALPPGGSTTEGDEPPAQAWADASGASGSGERKEREAGEWALGPADQPPSGPESPSRPAHSPPTPASRPPGSSDPHSSRDAQPAAVPSATRAAGVALVSDAVLLVATPPGRPSHGCATRRRRVALRPRTRCHRVARGSAYAQLSGNVVPLGDGEWLSDRALGDGEWRARSPEPAHRALPGRSGRGHDEVPGLARGGVRTTSQAPSHQPEKASRAHPRSPGLMGQPPTFRRRQISSDRQAHGRSWRRQHPFSSAERQTAAQRAVPGRQTPPNRIDVPGHGERPS